jgi:hypothetical protein
MSVLTDLLDWGVKKLMDAVRGNPNELLEAPLGQLESEKAKQDIADRRRDRQNGHR